LEYLDLATSMADLKVSLSNRSINWNETGLATIRFPSTISGGFAFGLTTAMRTTLRWQTIIDARCAMSIPNRRERKVQPTHPGVRLREDFLPEYGLTVSGFAQALNVSRQTVNELLRERRAVSPEMALRLSRLFGNSPEFWLNAQRAVDLWEAAKNIKGTINHISPLTAA